MNNEEIITGVVRRALRAVTRGRDQVVEEEERSWGGTIFGVLGADGRHLQVTVTDVTAAHGPEGVTPMTAGVTPRYERDDLVAYDAHQAREDVDDLRAFLLQNHPSVLKTYDSGRAGVSNEVIEGRDGSAYDPAEEFA